MVNKKKQTPFSPGAFPYLDTAPAPAPDNNAPFDINKLNTRDQQIFNAGFGKAKGAEDKTQEELANLKTEYQGVLTKLTQQEQSATLTKQELEALKTKKRELEDATMTAEQKHARDLQEVQETHKTALTTAQAESANWKAQFENTLLENALTSEAVAQDAFMPSQVVAMMKSITVAHPIQEDGKPTKYEPRVSIVGEDGKAKLVPVKDGMTHFLKSNPNLKKSQVVPGTQSSKQGEILDKAGVVITKAQLMDARWVNSNTEKVSELLASGDYGRILAQKD